MHFAKRWGTLACAGLVYSIGAFSVLPAVGQTSSGAPVIAAIPDKDVTQYNGSSRHLADDYFFVDISNATSATATGMPRGVYWDYLGQNYGYRFVWSGESIGAGVFNVTVTATNASGTASRSFRWVVHPSMMSHIFPDKTSYKVGDVITLKATYSVPVVVTGSPYIQLWPGKNAVYTSGSGGTQLQFQATVTASDTTHTGLSAHTITAGTGTIATPDGASANLVALASPDALGGTDPTFDVVVGQTPSTGPTPPPPPTPATITKLEPPVALTYSSSPYAASWQQIALIHLTFSAPVTVTGAPSIKVRIGSTERQFVYGYVSSNPSNVLSFSYHAATGDNGALSITGPILLNGGSIKSDGMDASLTFTPVDTPNVLFDSTPPPPPVVTGVTPASPTPEQAFTISGTSEAGSTVFGPAGASADVAADGRWSMNFAPRAAGTYAFVFHAMDRSSLFSSDTTFNVTVQPAPSTPTPPVVTPPPAAVTPPPPVVVVTPPPPVTTPPPVVTTPPPVVTPTAPPPLAPQTITFNSPVSAIRIGTPITLGATSSAGLPIAYSIVRGDATLDGSTLTPCSTAQLVVRASQAGNDTTAAASVDVDFGSPERAAQSVSLTTLPAQVVSDHSLALAATASSGLPIGFEVVSGPATISGTTLTPTAAVGTVVLRAVQSGNDTFSSAAITQTLTILPATRLINLSSRVAVRAGDGSRAFIAGFVVSGPGPKRMLARAVGPALTQFGVQAALANPRLRIFDQAGNLAAENDDWSGDDVAAAAARVGAFALPRGGRDAALLITLAPGAYSLHVDAATTGDGVALAELYDASDVPALETQQVVNISTRAFVDTGEGVLTAGFVVTGSAPKRVLIRGIGPSLTAFGVTGALADPVLTLQQGTTVLAQNDDWQTAQSFVSIITPAGGSEIATAATNAGAFPLANGSKDAALLLTLAPGVYTATLRGANNTTGAGLVEVYEVP